MRRKGIIIGKLGGVYLRNVFSGLGLEAGAQSLTKGEVNPLKEGD